MKHTEQRWMHLESGRIRKSGFDPCKELVDNYLLVTVTWDEPEYEDVEVVQWACVDNGVVLSVHDTFEEARNWANQDKVGCNVIELKGIDRRRKPEPEVETYLVCETYNSNGYRIGQIQVPETLIGKRVRVEVVE